MSPSQQRRNLNLSTVAPPTHNHYGSYQESSYLPQKDVYFVCNSALPETAGTILLWNNNNTWSLKLYAYFYEWREYEISKSSPKKQVYIM